MTAENDELTPKPEAEEAGPAEQAAPASNEEAAEPEASAATAPAAAEPAGEAKPAAEEAKPEAAPAAAEAKPDAKPAEEEAKPAAKPAAKAKPEEEEPPPPPEPTPETCHGIVIGMDAFEKAVLDGEFDGSDYLFYLEPAGVMGGDLICARGYPAESVRGGILMTRAAREAKTVFFDDGINPERYELAFPKEFGYVKSVQHYQPESREHARYPFSKKY